MLHMRTRYILMAAICPSQGALDLTLRQRGHRQLCGRRHAFRRSSLRMNGGSGVEADAKGSPIDFYYWPVPCGWKVDATWVVLC